MEFPILCQVGQNRVFAINFDQELDINNRERTTIKDQEQYFDYAFLLGMRGYGLHSLSNFAHRLQKSLPERQQSLTKTDVNKNIAMTIGYLTSKGIYKGSGDQLSANNFEYLKDELERLEKKFEKDEMTINHIRDRAGNIAKAFTWASSSIVVG